jgi:hypothetical protein
MGWLPNRLPAACGLALERGASLPVLVVAWLKREIMQRFALLPWGDENWVPSAGWRVRAGAGWGFAVVRVAVAGAEGAQWWRRAACRHCSRLDRSRP